MIEGPINLISDTQTRPTTAILEAMMAANVGDEQKGLDPTVNQLCEYDIFDQTKQIPRCCWRRVRE